MNKNNDTGKSPEINVNCEKPIEITVFLKQIILQFQINKNFRTMIKNRKEEY